MNIAMPMSHCVRCVLFLCTRNSARSAGLIQGLLALPLAATDDASLGNALAAIAQDTRPAALEPVT
jgi:hypothetical protein